MRIELPRIKDYVDKLVSRGLRAVIITGGGEPTLYPDINDLVNWLKLERGLSVAMITNGTLTHRVHVPTWKLFSWVRVSINTFNGFERRIRLPRDILSADCVLGCSFIVSSDDDIAMLPIIASSPITKESTYIRVLPNCLLPQERLTELHAKVKKALEALDDERFFHQDKNFRAPNEDECHQSFFRPYLSEVPWHGDGIPGSVYPCDSVVLNDAAACFEKKYQLCKLENVLDHLDGRVEPAFSPHADCKNCVFCHSVEMLGRFKRGEQDERASHVSPLVHEEFV
jgi:hypothetical protein